MRMLFAIALVVATLTAAPAQAAEPPAGAAACTGCHPATPGVETPVPRLAGRDAAQIAAAMQIFRNGGEIVTVMNRIAKGFTDAEIQAIAAWYAAQH